MFLENLPTLPITYKVFFAEPCPAWLKVWKWLSRSLWSWLSMLLPGDPPTFCFLYVYPCGSSWCSSALSVLLPPPSTQPKLQFRGRTRVLEWLAALSFNWLLTEYLLYFVSVGWWIRLDSKAKVNVYHNSHLSTYPTSQTAAPFFSSFSDQPPNLTILWC